MKRRTYLAVLGGTTTFLAGCPALERDPEPDARPPDPPEPETEPVVETFETTIDMVEDAGCDPTGEEACDGAIGDALADDTLLRFRDGTYRFEEPVDLRETDYDRVGLAGDGDVTFVPPPGFNDHLVSVMDVGEVIFEGIDVDVTESDTTAGIRLVSDRSLRVADLEFRGRGTHPDDAVVNALTIAVRRETGHGVVRNVVSRRGSAIGHYKNGEGRVGVWIGRDHHGTVTIEGCHFEEFGNNAIYASRTTGNVRVRGGYFRNNNVSSVRISGLGSVVDGATIEVDLDEYTGPYTDTEDQVSTRAIVIEQGPFENESGATVRNCAIRIVKTPYAGPAISVWPTGRTLTVVDTEIEMSEPSPAIYRAPKEPQVNDHPPSEPPRWLHVEDVTITGSASDWAAISILDGAGSVVRNCSIDQTGTNRKGIRLVRSPRSIIDGGTVRTSSYPLSIDSDGESDSDECYVTFERLPLLESTALDTMDGATVERASTIHESTTRCIGSAFVSDHGRGGDLEIIKLNADEVWMYGA